MTAAEWKSLWREEEAQAHIHGWDFSPIQGRFAEEHDLPWSYRRLVQESLRDDMALLDYDTGGGEFLRSLRHPAEKTAATEGYPPNVQLCRETLLPLGVDFQECADPSHIPFPDESFDIILNRHGAFDPAELLRLLRPGGLFLTEQVGEDNDRDLVERVLPGTPKPFPHGSSPASPWTAAWTASSPCRRSWKRPGRSGEPSTAISSPRRRKHRRPSWTSSPS